MLSACSKETTIWPQPDIQQSSIKAAPTMDPGRRCLHTNLPKNTTFHSIQNIETYKLRLGRIASNEENPIASVLFLKQTLQSTRS